MTATRLENLLDRWEEAQEEGEPLTPEQLCADCPELLEELKQKIHALQLIDAQLGTEVRGQTLGATPDHADSLLKSIAPQQAVATRAEYARLRFHAKGGLGALYVATDAQLHREVALKFIRRQYAFNLDSRDRFLLEAEVTSRLEHPGVVPVYGMGETDNGRLFYAMRFIQGESLEAAIERYHCDMPRRSAGQRALEFRQLLARFVSVCNTLAYAHNRGIVHRDIKPENIMLGRFGETLLVDWGLALPISRDQQARASGEATLMPSSGSSGGDSAGGGAGTPAYMSPEQIAGTQPPSPTGDIYSLGVTLYKILCGQGPFRAEQLPEMLQKVQAGDFEPPCNRKKGLPKALEAVCLKAMSRQPSDRYPTAIALASDVERWLADEPVSAWREPRMRTIGRWARRHRAAVQAMLASLLVLAVVGVASAVWMQGVARREHRALLAANEAHDQGLTVSAKFAARTVGSELDVRWRILEAEASDQELRTLLARMEEAPDDASLRASLQAWLDSQFIEHNGTTKADSWFINDRRGVQVARSPASDSIGESFAHRDYFHGRGHDLEPSEAQAAEPIRHVNLSAAYRSSTSGALKVACSAPIYSGKVGSANRQVLGVLAMSVDVGHFGILQTDFNGGQTAVLVDLREDRLGGERQRGLVLHHPALEAPGRAGKPTKVEPLRLPDDQSRQLIERLQSSSGPGADRLLPQYVDPASEPGALLRAAFERVWVPGRPDEIADTGWVVIVQEDPAGAP